MRCLLFRRIGYRPSYFIFLFVGIISGVLSTFTIDYWTWLLTRFMVATTVPMMLTAAYVIRKLAISFSIVIERALL